MFINLSQFCQNVIHNLLFGLLLYFEYLNIVIEHLAREPNVDSGLKFVASKHPEFYTSLLDGGNCFSHFFLELVLNSSSSNKFKLVLNFCNHCFDLELLILNGALSLFIFFCPSSIKFVINSFLTNHESSEPLISIIIQMLQGLFLHLILSLSQQWDQNRISSFAHHLYFSLWVSHNYCHSLTV